MANGAPYKYDFLVTIFDHPGGLPKRIAARPAHLAKLKPRIESGQVVFGGAILSKQPGEGESPDMTGSVMLIKANSEEEVREIVLDDEYAKQGLWNLDAIEIRAFRCAVRTAL